MVKVWKPKDKDQPDEPDSKQNQTESVREGNMEKTTEAEDIIVIDNSEDSNTAVDIDQDILGQEEGTVKITNVGKETQNPIQETSMEPISSVCVGGVTPGLPEQNDFTTTEEGAKNHPFTSTSS